MRNSLPKLFDRSSSSLVIRHVRFFVKKKVLRSALNPSRWDGNRWYGQLPSSHTHTHTKPGHYAIVYSDEIELEQIACLVFCTRLLVELIDVSVLSENWTETSKAKQRHRPSSVTSLKLWWILLVVSSMDHELQFSLIECVGPFMNEVFCTFSVV